MRPEAVEAALSRGSADFDRTFANLSAPHALAALREEHTLSIKIAYDRDLAARAAAIEAEQLEAQRQLVAELQAAGAPPVEPNPDLDATRELAALQRWQGRTLAELAAEYERTGDDHNPTFVRLVESDRGAFRLREDPRTDAAAIDRLNHAIGARREARVSAELKDAVTRVRNLLKPIRVSAALDHLRSGRGVAVARQ
jgi:hypothetical protein